jgi:hypothetical protein
MTDKEKCDKSAKENREIARQFSERGDYAGLDAALSRAIEDEKCRDSWLYRTFGW